MRLKCFKKFCFVLMLTGLYSCGSMEGAADSTPIPTSVYITGILLDSGSDKGETSADKEGDARFDPDGFGDDKAGNTGSDLDGAELTKLPVRGWEYWEKEGYTKKDIVICDNDILTLKLLGWDSKNSQILLECQNKTNRDVYFSAVSDFYVNDFAVGS